MKQTSQKFLKQRKFMLVMPLLALPFIVMIFWALGGGQNAAAQHAQSTVPKGLNTQLPDAKLNNDRQDKLSFYRQADKDSLKLKNEMNNDPNYHSDTTGEIKDTATVHSIDPNEDKINKRLALLNQQLNTPQPAAGGSYSLADLRDNRGGNSGGDVDRLEAMMKTMNQKGNDPEMQQLNGMLDKILDIQQPDRAKEQLREQSLKNKKQAYPVTSAPKDEMVSFLNNTFGQNDSLPVRQKMYSDISGKSQNAFLDWNDNAALNTDANAIDAVVEETMTIVSGATIKLKLLNDIYLAGQLIPKNQFIYGTCAIANDRLLITVNSIRAGNSLYPVSLSGYDMDGLAGIYIPDAISRDVAKSSADEAVQGLDVYSLNPSVGAQAAAAGISAAKTLFSKKVKLVKVTIRAGHRILLKDSNAQ